MLCESSGDWISHTKMWLKSSCVVFLWRTLHLLARSNTCTPKSSKGSRSRALCQGILSPPSQTWLHASVSLWDSGACEGSTCKQSGEKLDDVKSQGVIIFSEVNVVVKVVVLVRERIWKVLLKKKSYSLDFCLLVWFILQGTERSVFMKHHTHVFPWNGVVLPYSLCFHKGFNSLEILSFSQFLRAKWSRWTRRWCCFYLVTQSFPVKRKQTFQIIFRKGNLEL